MCHFCRTAPAGVLFCVGGRGGSGDPFRSIECYSIAKNSWFFGPEMNSRRRHVGVISVGGEAVNYANMEVVEKGREWAEKPEKETSRRNS